MYKATSSIHRQAWPIFSGLSGVVIRAVDISGWRFAGQLIPNWRMNYARQVSPFSPVLLWLLLLGVLNLTACSTPKTATTASATNKPVFGNTNKPGGYYQNDGPGDNPPPNLENLPDAVPQIEPLAKFANRPYQVFGQDYVPQIEEKPFKERGKASWYGRQFHGQKTSNGEIYNMYTMTAAHKTLPLPSYARVTNLTNGKQIVVRVNDRGPFHPERIIDLSYAAALKLGYLGHGSTQVEVERILPTEILAMQARGDIKGDIGSAATVKADEIARSNPYDRSRLAAQPLAESPRLEEAKVTPVTSLRNPVGQALPESVATASSTSAPAMTAPTTTDSNVVEARNASTPINPQINTSEAPTTIVPEINRRSGIWLQLGVFAARNNAESLKEKISRDLATEKSNSNLANSLIDIVSEFKLSGTLYKLWLGPFTDHAMASQVAQQIMQRFNTKPLLVER